MGDSPVFMRRTKIVCTIGPATQDYKDLLGLHAAGMNLLRLNMSHGDETFYRSVVKNMRRVEKEKHASLGLLWDLQGPEIRTGDVDEAYILQKGDTVCLTSRPSHETGKGVISVSYDQFQESLGAGDIVFLDNGALKLEVLSVQGTEVRCRVKTKGEVRSRMHLNLQGKPVKLPSLSQKDLEDLKLGVKLGADWVALSYVRSVDDIKSLKKHLKQLKSKAWVMAKIETPEAVEAFDEIAQEADGIMVARGDLGSEMPFEEVPGLQDMMVKTCRAMGKPVVIATHMLESMILRPTPTRAEATDVAHAVRTSADATMLSGETAIGEYAHDSVQAMARIIDRTELIEEEFLEAFDAYGDKSEMLLSASALADQVTADALVVFSVTGESVRLLSSMRPSAPIIAFVQDKKLIGRLQLLKGVRPLYLAFGKQPEKVLHKGLELLRSQQILRKKAKVVIVSDRLLGKQQRVSSLFLTTLQ